MPVTRRRQRVRIVIEHTGTLSKYGYSLKKSQLARHRALAKATRVYPPGKVIQKVNAIAVFNKRRHKGVTRKARGDIRYVQKKLEGKS